MKKITKIFEIDYNLHWDGSVEIEEIERDLAAIKKLGATHVDFEANSIYDSTILDVTAISIREESDEESKPQRIHSYILLA